MIPVVQDTFELVVQHHIAGADVPMKQLSLSESKFDDCKTGSVNVWRQRNSILTDQDV